MFDFASPPEIRGEILDDYLSKGWFRISTFLFTLDHTTLDDGKEYPVCWLRYDVNRVKLHRSVTKVISANKEFATHCHDLKFDNEIELLFTRYRKKAKFIEHPTLESILVDKDDKTFDSKIMEVRHNGHLIAAGVFDVGTMSIEHVISIYEPAYEKHSLGKFLITSIYKYCFANGYQYYYPGYFLPGQQVLSYKLFLDKGATEGFSINGNKWVPIIESGISQRG